MYAERTRLRAIILQRVRSGPTINISGGPPRTGPAGWHPVDALVVGVEWRFDLRRDELSSAMSVDG